MFRMKPAEIYKPDTFLYFAYTADMWSYRARTTAPSAKFVSAARLDNYRLDLIKYSSFWGGPTGSLVPTANAHTWGVVWRVHKDDLLALDDQKDVGVKKSFIKFVSVLTPHMGELVCRAYIQKVNPLPKGDREEVAAEQWPSRVYKKVIILGAIEHRIPDYYIQMLEKLKDNGQEGCLRLAILLRTFEKGLLCKCLERSAPPERISRKLLKLDLNELRADRQKQQED